MLYAPNAATAPRTAMIAVRRSATRVPLVHDQRASLPTRAAGVGGVMFALRRKGAARVGRMS
jgi:hypothetical protein